MIRIMKSIACLMAAFVVGLAGGCKTSEPGAIETVTATISFKVAPASLDLFDCYDQWEDKNHDGVIDTVATTPTITAADEELIGETCTPAGGQQLAVYPWNHVTIVSVIRAGTTQREVIASSAGTSGQYEDITALSTDSTPLSGPAPDPPPGANFVFVNGARVTNGTRKFLRSVTGGDLIIPNLFDPRSPDPDLFREVAARTSIDVGLHPGDTLFVEARAAVSNPLSYPTPTFSAALTLDGRSVVPTGKSETAIPNGSLAFSVTRN